VPPMIARLTASLREAPTTVPALVAVAVFLVWASDQAGYPLTHWAPGGLIVLALLGIALATVGPGWSDVPLAVKVALGSLAAYTALSFLSILWAAVPSDAWEGANRTLLYLLVFALFAWWPQRASTARLILVAWTLAMACLAAYVALHVNAASRAGLATMFGDGRLVYPTGYANADAALWLMAFWPAFLLARSERLGWALRGLLAGAAVLLAQLALLSQSRGSLYATPLMLLAVFAFLPGRVRTFALLVPVAAGIGATAPSVLRVGNRLQRGGVSPDTLHAATNAMFAATVAVAVVVAVAAAVEQRLELSEGGRSRVRRALGACAVVSLLAVVVGGLVAVGDPGARIKHAWDTFKSPRGYAANSTGGRLTSGLGSERYDFYRVALDEFASHPLVGIGADNFQQAYLLHRRSSETPHYPHSIEFRTLSQTGLVGVLIAVVGLAAALLAAGRAGGLFGATGGSEALARDLAVAALAGFAYWAIHGSFDWFFEFAGLGAPAFALLGLAVSLAPRPARRAGPASAPRASPSAAEPSGAGARERGALSRRPLPAERSGAAASARGALARRLAFAGGGLSALAMAISFLAPWMSGLQIQRAARIWTTSPASAYGRLSRAAQLNPLSDEAYLLAGSIALRYRDLPRAQQQFTHALSRVPGDDYATLELGAIASARGERRRAQVLLRRAVRLDPRDRLSASALRTVLEGRRVSVEELNRGILEQAHRLS
jgi:tetratricopeptide (TPR) repeat protein